MIFTYFSRSKQLIQMNYYQLLIFSLLLFLTACTNSTVVAPEKESPSVISPEQPDTLTPTLPSINRTTIEGFWSNFQKAVLSKDIPTIESFYATGSRAYKFQQDYYQEKIATTSANAFQKSPNTYKDQPVYEVQFILSEEGISEDEAPTTTISIQKNEAGIFEIFNVLEAG